MLGAVAVGLGVAAAAGAGALARLLSRRRVRGAGLVRDLRAGTLAAFATLPVIAMGLPVRWASRVEPPEEADAGDNGIPRYRDIEAVADALARVGWSRADAQTRVATPDDLIREALLSWPPWPGGGAVGAAGGGPARREQAYVLQWSPVAGEAPEGFRAIASSTSRPLLLGMSPSWIDWGASTACATGSIDLGTGPPAEGCPEIVIARDPWPEAIVPEYEQLMPALFAGQPLDRIMFATGARLKLRLRPDGRGLRDWIYLPLRGCPGHIVAVEGPSGDVEESGRLLKLEAPDAADVRPRQAEIEWSFSGPHCSPNRWHLPYFIEGDPDTVSFLKRLAEDHSFDGVPSTQ